MRGRTLALLLLAAVVALPGCGGGEEGGAAAGGTDVTLSDFSIEPASIEVEDSGRVTLNVTNDGDVSHALVLGGVSTGMLAPGTSAELTAELGEGAYTLFCPVGDHRSQGMEAALTVGDAPARGGTTGDDEDDSGRGYGNG